MPGYHSGTPASSSDQGNIGQHYSSSQGGTQQDPSAADHDTCDEGDTETIDLTNIGVCDGTNDDVYAQNMKVLDDNVYLARDREVEGRYWLVCWKDSHVGGQGICYFGKRLYNALIEGTISYKDIKRAGPGSNQKSEYFTSMT